MSLIVHELDQIAITVKSHMLLRKLLKENPVLDEIMRNARNETEALIGVRNWILEELKKHPDAYKFYKREAVGREAFEKVRTNNLACNCETDHETETVRG